HAVGPPDDEGIEGVPGPRRTGTSGLRSCLGTPIHRIQWNRAGVFGGNRSCGPNLSHLPADDCPLTTNFFNRPLDIAGEPALEEIGFKLAADLEDHRLRRGFEAHRTVEEPRVTVPTNLPNQSLDQLRLIGGGADGLNWGRVNS